MRRGRFITGVTSLAAAALISAPGAAGATPQQIYKDFADNGRLDKAYTNAELKAAIKDASLQVYPSPQVGVTLRPTVSNVLGAQRTAGKSPLATARRSGSLPFTGAELTIFALVGIALVTSGVLLRTTARQKSRS